MVKEIHLTLLDRLFVIWTMLMCASITSMAGWVLMFRTDPSYFAVAAVQVSLIVIFVLWIYIKAITNVLKKRDWAITYLKFIFWWWAGLFVAFAIVSFLPNENNDDYASTRYAIGLTVLAVVVGIQFLFWRKLSTARLKMVKND